MHRRNSGFTLLEMIVALALVGLVTFYVTDMLVRQNRAYTVVDEVTGAQQNLRAIGDLIEREARVTGFMVPEAGAFCGYDNVNAPDIVFFSDADSINPANQTDTDMVADITAGYPGGTLTLSVPGTGQGVVLDGAAFYDTDANAVADSDFFEGGGVIVFDRSNPGAGTSCGVVTQVNGTNSIDVDWRIRAGVGAAAGFLVGAGNETLIPAGGDLVAIPAHWYAVVPAANTGTAAPQLWRDGMMIADDVEDLQFAAFYDLDGDGLVTGVLE
ncbi:MAG: prepilin-type N-terminal cleavage/methylation domain-containing protein, partial [Myxococcota bacterium]|nr:prepilin-type N-terminal cleavage/methylation domain-containing protein [Myxococcota bacterium]